MMGTESRWPDMRSSAPFLVLFLAFLFGCNSDKQDPQTSGENLAASIPPETPAVSSARVERAEDLDRQLELVEQGESYAIRLKSPAPDSLWSVLSSLDGKLQDLLLDGGGVAEPEFVALGQSKSLVHLRIRNAKLSDDALLKFASGDGLDDLQILNLPQAQFSAKGLRGLAALPKLKQLRLGGKQLDDAAIEVLATLPQLRSLHLIGPSMTAEGLAHLEKAPSLASFYLDDCKLPDSAWESLFQAKPELHVHIDQYHHDRDPKRHEH